MERLSTALATSFIEAICSADGDFSISDYARKIMKGSPSLSTIPADRKYVVLSIKRDLVGAVRGDYDNLRQKVVDAGFTPIESHRELSAYALEHWDELREAGYRLLSSSAPSVLIGDWLMFVAAGLDYSNPCLNVHNVRYSFYPSVAVLAYVAP